ncbi:MAG TPA: ABC transporter permease [Nitriliruptoraceae bacterium]|nr:ABC transporter permease [Nitriliruptoraceae bacterium]
MTDTVVVDVEAEVDIAAGGRRDAIIEIAVIYGLGVIVALLVNAALLAALGANPVTAYGTIVSSALGSVGGLAQTLNRMTPLLLGATAVAFAMRAGYVNLGVDGQIYAGAILATGVAFLLDGWPAWLLLPVVLLAGVVGGGLLASIPAWLRATRGVNELFVTVMLNFVALFLAEYLATGPWTDPVAGEAITVPIPDAANLPVMLPGGGHAGILLAVPIAVAASWWLLRTRRGFEFRAVGANSLAARFGGVRLVRIGVIALVVAGALGGLAGSIEVTGVHSRLLTGLTPNFGYMAVLIAVLARRSPVATIPVAFAFAVLIVGADSLQRSVNLPASAVLVFQAVVVVTILAFETPRGRRWVSRLLPGSGRSATDGSPGGPSAAGRGPGGPGPGGDDVGGHATGRGAGTQPAGEGA